MPIDLIARRCGAWLALCLLSACLLSACVPFAPPRKEPAPLAVEPAASAPEPAASAPPVPAAAVATAADMAARDMLLFHDRARQMPTGDVSREIAARNPDPNNPRAMLELAILLGYTKNNGDVGRALALVDALVRQASPEAAPYQPLARLLQMRYLDQRRLEEQLERQNAQARDSQRRIDQLNDKLEALKAIERSLSTRPAASGAAASAPPPKAGAQ